MYPVPTSAFALRLSYSHWHEVIHPKDDVVCSIVMLYLVRMSSLLVFWELSVLRGLVTIWFLSFDNFQEDTQWGGLKAGQVMVDAQPIFKRIEVLEEEAGNPPPKAKGKKEGKKSKQKAPAAAASNSV